jgi:serine/threonine-protein kinase
MAVMCARVLWSSRPLSLRTLRALEVVGFSSITAAEVWRIVVTWRAGELFRYVTADNVGMALLSGRQSLTWFTLIVSYGIFIPNTWRRCALVVGLLAATPIVTAAICNSVFGALDDELLAAYLFNVAIWMLYAGALAIYGSHRIDVLRNEAQEARELGQYRLKRLLGTGGMGEVYLAEHLLLRRPCALKLIRTDRAGNPDSLRRFEREVHATAALTHPNTVHVYDYGHTVDGTFYYVMEYLPGLTLEGLIQEQGPLPASRVIHLLRQICGALSEAHAAGLIHRDVKPGNIIVCERGGVHDVAKLVDFGIVQSRAIADQETSATAPGAMVGTPSFMSPEQVNRADVVDERSDIYSLGAVGYFLLTGRPPFLRATAAETAAAHLHASVIAPDQIQRDVPADLQSVILRCLRKNPDQRFQSAAALDAALALCAGARSWQVRT